MPGHRASSQSEGRATGGPWSNGESPVPGGMWGLEAMAHFGPHPLTLAVPSGEGRPPHLAHMVSNATIGHHFQGVQGHLLGPGAVWGDAMAEPVGEQEVQDHCRAKSRWVRDGVRVLDVRVFSQAL